MAELKRRCQHCSKSKPLSDFGSLVVICKQCWREYMRERRSTYAHYLNGSPAKQRKPVHFKEK